MSVLRWWFTLNYQALRADAERTAFELHGPGVQVLSENELLTAHGERVHTGKSEEPTLQLAKVLPRRLSCWRRNTPSMPICVTFSIWLWSLLLLKATTLPVKLAGGRPTLGPKRLSAAIGDGAERGGFGDQSPADSR